MIFYTYPLSDHMKKGCCVDCKWAKNMGEKTAMFRPTERSDAALMQQYKCRHDDAAFADRQNEAGKVLNCEKWVSVV